MTKTLILTFLTFLSSVATSLVAVWVETKAQSFGDVSSIGYAIVFMGAFGGSISTLIAKLQQQPQP